MLLLPTFATSHHKSSRLGCVNNLKEISLGYRIWEGDNNDAYPMAVSCTNGGAMEQMATGDVVGGFQVMSNELSTPKILICPADDERIVATNFSDGFTAKNISYFIGVNATEKDPQMLLTGDDNFEVGGVTVKSGILKLTSSQSISWSAARHKFTGNVAITDGSVQQLNISALQNAFSLSTNRIAIP